MSVNISFSSELMSNYMQAETAGPGQKFQAIQNEDGHSLLFSIGTDKVFYLTEEVPAQGSKTGWNQHDLSTVLNSNFPNATAINANTFAVGQGHNNTAFTALLALTVDDSDHLFIASHYTKTTDGTISMDWTELVFDDPTANATDTINISNIYLMQLTNSPLIVVDLQDATTSNIDRYFIDTKKEISLYNWNLYTLPVDMTAANSVAVCGRKDGDLSPGVYTMGNVGNSPSNSIVYQEMYDPWTPGNTGSITRLNLPDGVSPISIATTPSSSSSEYTDLYVTADNGTLYFFAADNQSDNAQGFALFTNTMFQTTNTLFAYTNEQKVVVWGLNRAGEIFYTQCNTAEVSTPTAWSYPLSLANNVEQISPYVNKINGGNTYFAHIGTDTFKKVFQDPISSNWTTQDILLTADLSSTAKKFNSFTTLISVIDENNTPIGNTPILISSAYRVPVYVNNHYYVLDNTPISIETNYQGSIQIVQRIDNMQGALLMAQSDPEGDVIKINPMDNATNKVLQLNSSQNLSNATVTDDKGNSPTPLVPTNEVSSDDLDNAAASINALSDAYSSYAPSVSTPQSSLVPDHEPDVIQTNLVSGSPDTIGDFAEAIVVSAGDLFSHLLHAEEYVVQILFDETQQIYNFICQIGEDLFTFVIDTVEKVVGAIQAVFQAIKTAIDDLIQFVKFLFAWGDIQLTKDVFKNMTLVIIQSALDEINTIEDKVDTLLENLKTEIDNWANPIANSDDTTLNSITSSQDTSQMNSASTTFLQYHFTNNAANATYPNGVSGGSDNNSGSLLDHLSTAIENEEDVLLQAINSFKTEILDADYKTMSLEQLLKDSIQILADAILETAENVLDTLIQMILTVAEDVIEVLATPIWIPILSDILEEFFDDAISFSWLDVILLVGALPATLIYKMLTGNAPFSDDDGFSNQLADPSNDTIEKLKLIINGASIVPHQHHTAMGGDDTPSPQPKQVSLGQKIIFPLCRFTSTINDLVSALLVYPTNTPGTAEVAAINIASLVNSLAGAANGAIASTFASPAPMLNEKVGQFGTSLTSMTITEKVIFACLVIKSKLSSTEIPIVSRVDKVLTLILKFLGGITAGVHLYELIEDYDDYPNQIIPDLAIIEVANQFCGIANNAVGTLASFSVDGEGKQAELLICIGIDAVEAVLDFVQCILAVEVAID